MLKFKNTSITHKFSVLFLLFSITITLLIFLMTYNVYKQSIMEKYAKEAAGYASITAVAINPDDIKKYKDNPTPDAEYDKINSKLEDFRTVSGLDFLYVIVPVSEDKIMYIFDCEDANEPHSHISNLGDIDYYYNFKLAKTVIDTSKASSSLDIGRTDYGYLASAYAPILDDDSNTIALVGVDIKMNKILSFLSKNYANIIFIIALVVSLCSWMMLKFIKKTIIHPIKLINEKTEEFSTNIASSDVSYIQVNSHDELYSLALSVNQMFDEIRHYTHVLEIQVAQRQKIDTELKVARDIQESTLPREFPVFSSYKEFDIYAVMHPAKEVGGDFYDFFFVDENHLAVVIADVSHRGVPAALFMMIAKAFIKNEFLAKRSVSEVLEVVNNQLCRNNSAGMFVTAFVGLLDINTGEFEYASAGHVPPLLKKNGEKFGFVSVGSDFVLAGAPQTTYSQSKMTLSNGDILFLYTDGVTNAFNGSFRRYSCDDLQNELNTIENIENFDAFKIVEHIDKKLDEFTSGMSKPDDITMLVLRYLK